MGEVKTFGEYSPAYQKNTIEEKIKYRLRQKQQIISEVVDGEDLEKMKPVELMQILREGGEA